MGVEALAEVCDELSESLDVLTSVGAALRLKSEGLVPHPRIGSLLAQIVEQVNPGLLDGIGRPEAAMWASNIITELRQALDFIENPARQPGWSYDDPAIIDNQGRASRLIVRKIEAIAERRPSLAETLRRPGRFLDIGTGAGWISIEAAQRWPAFHAVGIDIWDPSLALAKRNVEANGLSSRVAIRKQGLEALDEESHYDLAWLPGPFFPEAVAAKAGSSLVRCLKPGGTLIFLFFGEASSVKTTLLQDLAVARFGGHGWRQEEVETLLARSGFTEIACYRLPNFYPMIAASRPLF